MIPSKSPHTNKK